MLTAGFRAYASGPAGAAPRQVVRDVPEGSGSHDQSAVFIGYSIQKMLF